MTLAHALMACAAYVTLTYAILARVCHVQRSRQDSSNQITNGEGFEHGALNNQNREPDHV